MLVTTKYLDQAVAELQNIYTTSPDGALAGLTPPRFTLDDMTVDLSFVVADVRQSTEEPDPPTERVVLTPNQAAKVEELLGALFNKDREAFQAFEQEKAEHEARAEHFDREMAHREAAANAEIGQLAAKLQQLDIELRTLNSNPFTSNRAREHELQEGMRHLENRVGEVQRDLERRRASRPPAFTRERPRFIQAGESPYVVMWLEYLAAYNKRKQDYLVAVAAFNDEQPLGELDPPFAMTRSLAAALSIIDDRSGFPKAKVDGIRADFIQTDRSIAKLAELSAARAAGGIRVKVDPESISNAPPGALQSLHLTFRSQSQERVNVEGEGVEIER